MALMDIAVVPLDLRDGGRARFVAGLQQLLAASGCSYRCNDMGTTVEGPAPHLFELAMKLHEYAFTQGRSRVYTVVKIDDRRDRTTRSGQQEASFPDRAPRSGDGGE